MGKLNEEPCGKTTSTNGAVRVERTSTNNWGSRLVLFLGNTTSVLKFPQSDIQNAQHHIPTLENVTLTVAD